MNPTMKRIATTILTCMALAVTHGRSAERLNFNADWSFFRGEKAGADRVAFDAAEWDSVSLPHTANIEPLVVNDQWQGICWYRKSFTLPADATGKKVIIEFEGAMSRCSVWLNGALVKERSGGYLPVVIDITDHVMTGKKNLLAVRLDNTDNIYTGPKPLKRLDFCMYGGLYRNAWLIIKDKVHISHPVLADKVAGGGIFITTPKVSEEKSLVKVRTHVINSAATAKTVEVVQSIYRDETLVAESTSTPVNIGAAKDADFVEQVQIRDARLWSPNTPSLYTLKTAVRVDGMVMDEETTRFGIRDFEFRGHELYVNGKKTFLRGVNRHQEYPFVGYALSDNAQYRDAKKIKDAGFNHIRLSHYPHSPAFMDACDELGLITLNAIMGWQYFLDDDRFRQYCYRSATELIRRDRNRPSVVAWEVSLNESRMPVPFMAELHRITHAEYPGKHVYSAGWKDDVYDVFGQARQHRILHGYHENLEKPYFVSEYGDWEYYSSNAGLNQDKLDKTRRYESSSRQRRSYGEKRLLQQARNIQEAHNSNHDTYAYGDAYWVMYDYNRGYHDDIEFSGIMDIFRLPKFSYFFYQSQREPSEGAMIRIASYWTPESALDVKIYSNCDEVKLLLNNKLIGKQKPDSDEISTNLSHPPFTFKMGAFKPGTLKAVGLINGEPVTEYVVQTPGEAVELSLCIDESSLPPESGCNDVIFLYIAAVDANGTVIPGYSEAVELKIDGDASVMNIGDIEAEAGIATALVRVGDRPGRIAISASSGSLKGGFSFETKEPCSLRGRANPLGEPEQDQSNMRGSLEQSTYCLLACSSFAPARRDASPYLRLTQVPSLTNPIVLGRTTR